MLALRVSALLGFAAVSAAAAAPDAAASGPARGFPPGSARVLVEQKCTSCHVASQVTAHRKSADQWAETVDKMISHGAPVSDEEYTRIVDYLAANFGLSQPASATSPR